MSLKNVRGVVEKFLESKEAQSIAISGEWGSGKTRFWNDFIKEDSSKNLVKKYSYVSLFGINNLVDLKATIFDNAVSKQDIGDGASSSTWIQNVKEIVQSPSMEEVKEPGRKLLYRGRKNVSQIAPLLGSWGNVARSLSFFAIKNYVICLDDIERKGEGLPLKEVLGLVSILKEQRACRVVVILNDGELGKEKEILDSFKEKVFDSEIAFSPSVEECATLVFNKEWEHSEEVIEKVTQLGIKNIRVLQRIRRVIESLLPYVQGKDVTLTHKLIHSSVLLTWCYHSRGEEVPPYEMVKNSSMTKWMASSDKTEESKGKRLNEIALSNYGYRDSDEFALYICQYLENGYVQKDDFEVVVDSFHEMALKDRHTGSFTDAWTLFHDTFADNKAELVSTMRDRFMDGTKWISLNNAMGTVKLMRELDRDDVANEMVRCWIEMAKSEDKDLLNISSQHVFEGSLDQAFIEAVREAYANDKPLPTVDGTIKRMAEKNGWRKDDIDYLAERTLDDYYEFFMSIKLDGRLDSYVDTCLQFESFNDDERYQKIYKASSDALRKIASESHLNEIRISRYLPDVIDLSALKP